MRRGVHCGIAGLGQCSLSCRQEPWKDSLRLQRARYSSHKAVLRYQYGSRRGQRLGVVHAAASSSSSDSRGEELRTVVRLALPALVVVTSDPLQTLVDSAVLGTYSTLHLAAVGPNTAIFNSIFQIFTFIGITTATTVSGSEGEEEIRSTVSTAMSLAVFFGILSVLVLHGGLGSWILSGMGTDARVIPLAQEYLLIRAMGLPCVLVMNAFQGLCLGKQDTITPMIVCAMATAINIVWDVILVSQYHMGVKGAALATVSAQFCGMVAMGLMVFRSNTYSEIRFKDLFALPRADQVKKFATVGCTLIARTLAGMSAYVSMATAATRMGIIASASHQVAMQLFWFISYLPEPLSMAAQTLVAKEYTKNPPAAASWARMLVTSGVLFAIVLSISAAGALAWGAGLFSKDVLIRQTVSSLAPYGALAMAICSMMMMFDGISLGSNALLHLPAGVGLGLVSVLCILYTTAPFGLPSVWWALSGFYASRLFVHVLYYGIVSRPRNVFFVRDAASL
ncbi:hypothetical protein M9435_006514 [Picochlorum sp. BPE23]|nr:hypothetical protein M9435_006514 [Picochlorum sp. BPE23]